MKIAVAAMGNTVAGHFGHCENFIFFDTADGKITSVKTEEKKQFAPKLFSLSDLQATANKRFHYSASETVKVVQGLYEKKLVSYPRTDTNYIGSPEFDY